MNEIMNDDDWWIMMKGNIYLTILRGYELFILLRDGFLSKIWRDSKILRSYGFEQDWIILKLLIEIGDWQWVVCSLIDEWDGWESSELVLKLLPACSATLLYKLREVIPM